MQKAAVADRPEAVRQDVLEEPAAQRAGVEVGGTLARATGCAGGAGDGAVRERDAAARGEGALEDLGGEGCARGMAVRSGLAVHMPGDGPDVGVEVLPQAGWAHLVFAEGAGDGREGLNGDKEGGAGGEPGGAVLGEAAAWDEGMEVRGVRELSAPGMEEARKTGQVGAATALLLSEPFASGGSSRAQSGGGQALRRTAKGASGLRDGAGEEAMGAWEVLCEWVVEPGLGCVRQTRRARPSATRVRDAVLLGTAVALREAGSVRSGWAVWDGAAGLVV
jgi:hypothetical protein